MLALDRGVLEIERFDMYGPRYAILQRLLDRVEPGLTPFQPALNALKAPLVCLPRLLLYCGHSN